MTWQKNIIVIYKQTARDLRNFYLGNLLEYGELDAPKDEQGPFNYLAKCPPELQALNMNHWIEHEKNEQLFFRFDGREVRAVFTPKYKPINQLDLILEIYATRSTSF